MNADPADYDLLFAYTLAHSDPAFIHQHVVDAHGVQSAGADSKSIGVAFGLAGLYLYVERGFTGRAVQHVHRLLSHDRRPWPPFQLPDDRGAFTASNVMAASAGEERDAAIHAWCASVWTACLSLRPQLVQLLHDRGIT